MNANSSHKIRVIPKGGLDFQPAFSPDGKKITFTKERGGNGDVYAMKADGSLPEAADQRPDQRPCLLSGS